MFVTFQAEEHFFTRLVKQQW